MNATAPPFASRIVGWVLAVGGAAGAAAAFILTVEKIALLRDSAYVPSCSLNPILSCGSVMTTSQAEAFGFPNPLLGLMAFPVVAMFGVATIAGARLPRWMWLGLHIGTVFGIVFVHWLIYQSLYHIGALCPYCMVVWVVTITVFWYVTLASLHSGRITLPPRLRAAGAALVRNHTVGLAVWLLAIASLIAVRFWNYWSTLL